MNEIAKEYADEILAAIHGMMKQKILPSVIIGVDVKGNATARAIGKISRDQLQSIVARVMVGQIDPTILE